MSQSGDLPYVRACGSYRDIGRAVGEAARPLIDAALAYYRDNFEALAGVSFRDAERRAMDYYAFARRRYPELVEELEGLAEGSNQSLLAVLVPNCGEEFTCSEQTPASLPAAAGPVRLRAAPGCTAVALASPTRHIVGHDMDWYAVDLDKNIVFDVTTPSGVRFLTVAGVPYLPILGMNDRGIGYVGNTVSSVDTRLGAPNAFVRRWALEAASVDDMIARATAPRRSRGSNHMIADRSGRVIDVETSALTSAVAAPGPPGVAAWANGATAWVVVDDQVGVAHTNHYVHPDMGHVEGSWAAESRIRLARALQILREGMERGDDYLDVVTRVLVDRDGAPDAAICGYPEDGSGPQSSVTVASMICDLDEMVLHACAGPPSSNGYRRFHFS